MWNQQKLELYTERSRRVVQGIKERLKKKKRYEALLGVLLILWAAAGAQWIAGKLFFEPKEITEAFAKTNSKLSESMLEFVAEYGSDYLTLEDKKELLRYLGAGVGLKMEDEIQSLTEENRQVLLYQKQAKQAEIVLKCVTLGKGDTGDASRTHYLMVRIRIYEDNGEYIPAYQDRVRKLMDRLGAKEMNCTVQFAGNFAGRLSIEELNEITDQLLRELDAKVICDNRTEELYTVYAYAGGQDHSVTVDGKQINLQIAAAYEENEDRTRIYLATPMISGDW